MGHGALRCIPARGRAAANLLCQELDIAACCEGHQLKAVLVLPDDVQCLCPDRACAVSPSSKLLWAHLALGQGLTEGNSVCRAIVLSSVEGLY